MGLDNLENSGGPLRELFEKKNAGMSDRKSGEKSCAPSTGVAERKARAGPPDG